MAENPIERYLRWRSRLTHFIYLGDVAKAAEWKQFALKKKYQLLDIGNGSPLSHHIYPNEETKVSYKSGGQVDIIIIEVSSSTHGLITLSYVDLAVSEQTWFLPTKKALPYQIKHVKKPLVGGNIDWYSVAPNGSIKELISWDGPIGRNKVAPRSGQYSFDTRFRRIIYKDGLEYAYGPSGKVVFGAAIYKGNLVIAVGASQGNPPNIARNFSILYVKQANVPKNGQVQNWLTAGDFSIPFSNPEIQPIAPCHIMAFSQSGEKFATVWVFNRNGSHPTALIQGELAIDKDGVITATCEVQTATATGTASTSTSSSDSEGGSSSFSESSASSTTLLSVDFKAEELVTLNRHYSASGQSQGSNSAEYSRGPYSQRIEIDGLGFPNTYYDFTVTSSSAGTSTSTSSETVRIESSDGAINVLFNKSRNDESSSSESFSGTYTIWANTAGIDRPYYKDSGGGSRDSSEASSGTEDGLYSISFCDLRNGLMLYKKREGSTVMSASTSWTFDPTAGEFVVSSSSRDETTEVRAQIYQAGNVNSFYDREITESQWKYPTTPIVIGPEGATNQFFTDVCSDNPYDNSVWYGNRTGTTNGILAKIGSGYEFKDIPKIILTDDDPSVIWNKHLTSSHKGAEETNAILWPLFWV